MIPFQRPSPPSLLDQKAGLLEIEQARIFSNYGPINSRFEKTLSRTMFGHGGCVTVCNATIGLMIAIRAVVERADAMQAGRPVGRRYALMPSFTFAAAAHAAEWAGLTPLFCDIDRVTWAASATAEEALIARYGDEIAVIIPYATFGSCIDLERYGRLTAATGIPVVVDAAASLGSRDITGDAFGTGCMFPVVFSMHATKTFSTAEGGVIYCADPELLETLRVMGNFGFGDPRSATMPGLNSKLSEVTALLALARLEEFESVVGHRERLAALYRTLLPGWVFQGVRGERCAHQFMPVMIPEELEGRRDDILCELRLRGIGASAYFSPHVAEQPFFRKVGIAGDLRVTERVSRRILALPIWDEMSEGVVTTVCSALDQISSLLRPAPIRRTVRPGHRTPPMMPLPHVTASVPRQQATPL